MRMKERKRNPASPPLRAVYAELFAAFGPQKWWPGRTRFEVMVGAVLTQNTAWTNVEKAIRRLRRERVLQPQALHAVETATLAEWIRPAGYFRLKADRLKSLTTALMRDFDGNLNRCFKLSDEDLRAWLLAVKGIGPETADSILLYAAGRAQFVVDAYTRRVLERHDWLAAHASYDEVARLFMENLPRDVALYNEYHALIVQLGKTYCRPQPRCASCPLRHRLPR